MPTLSMETFFKVHTNVTRSTEKALLIINVGSVFFTKGHQGVIYHLWYTLLMYRGFTRVSTTVSRVLFGLSIFNPAFFYFNLVNVLPIFSACKSRIGRVNLHFWFVRFLLLCPLCRPSRQHQHLGLSGLCPLLRWRQPRDRREGSR